MGLITPKAKPRASLGIGKGRRYNSAMLSAINAAIFLWLCAGIALKRRRTLHGAMMSMGFAFDLSLLLYVELSARAIEQTVGKPPGAILVVHVALATIMLLLYPVVLYSGGKVYAGGEARRHKRVALPFMVTRLLVVITAWMVAH
ncbi:MAG: hypothetical protein BroJett014_27260 [Planctomycetota bacterium]|nr:MAG: hypothetical protein BroJett014_27260 [Planctomycetota bacterium]